MPVHDVTRGGRGSAKDRILSGAGLGVLGWFVPAGEVDAAVGDGLAWEQRFRSLPSRLGVYFVLALCLFSADPYREVLESLTRGLPLAGCGWQQAASTALTALRRRVGEKTMYVLFTRVCSSLSYGREPWSHLGGLLMVAWDGTTVKVPASQENIAAFGQPSRAKKNKKNKGKGGADAKIIAEDEDEDGDGDGRDGEDTHRYPQMRLVLLVACGTRALLGAATGPLTGKGTGERALAAGLCRHLRAGMVLLADRGFYSWELWHAAAGTGADLLWRVRSSMHLPVLRELPDGSYLATIADPAQVRRRNRRNWNRKSRGSKLPPDTGPLPGITVRVIEFTITVTADDGTARTARYRLVTTLLDWRRHPAPALARAYARRWAIETGIREFKTYLRGPGRILRSRTPDLARQELWAYLTVCQAIRALICRAAATRRLDPDRISFTAVLHAARRTLTTARTSMDTALAATATAALTTLIPRRQGRICPRAVREPASAYPAAHHTTTPLSHHAACTITITPPRQPTRNPPRQHKQPPTPPTQPP